MNALRRHWFNLALVAVIATVLACATCSRAKGRAAKREQDAYWYDRSDPATYFGADGTHLHPTSRRQP